MSTQYSTIEALKALVCSDLTPRNVKYTSIYDMSNIDIIEDTGEKLTIDFYTNTNKYTITCIDSGFISCGVSSRMPRAGEDWTRGRDLIDGKFSKDTWDSILQNIITYELVNVHKRKKDKRYEISIDDDIIRYTKNNIKVQHPIKGKIPFDIHKAQSELLSSIYNNEYSILLCPRQSGKSSIVCISALWHAMRNNNFHIVIYSSSIELISTITYMYDNIKEDVKVEMTGEHGISKPSSHTISFENNSTITVSKIANPLHVLLKEDVNPDMVFFDEMAYLNDIHISKRLDEIDNMIIHSQMLKCLTKSLVPPKVIMISSQKHPDTIFNKHWEYAVTGDPTKSSPNYEWNKKLNAVKLNWWDSPNVHNPDQFKIEMINSLGELQWKKDFEGIPFK